MSYDLPLLVLVINLKDSKSGYPAIFVSCFSFSLFQTDKLGILPRCPSECEWVKKCELYSLLKKSDFVTCKNG